MRVRPAARAKVSSRRARHPDVGDSSPTAFGGLIQDQQAWLQHQRAADGELLLLSAGQVAAAPAQHFLQHRKQLEDLLWNVPELALACRQADAQILFHRELRKDLPTLWNIADAESGATIGRESIEMPAVVEKLAGRGQQPHDATEQGGLAHAVAAHQAGA